MADLRIIRNTQRKECGNCGGIHEYISRGSDSSPCGTPVAFNREKALQISAMVAHGPEDVVRIPTDTVVVIGDEDRGLPKASEPELQHFTSRTRLA